jgi:16S rRNA (cytidine1402-2'-O)-methyltransferase
VNTQGLEPGLYIVATPIGNLSDLSPRAADILARADLLAVEDSRVTAKLLAHIGAKRPMTPYHDHNADKVRPELIARMAAEAVALVSDAGTPLISDPGYKLVRDARAAGRNVHTVPGPCAAIAALTLAGLPTIASCSRASCLPSRAPAPRPSPSSRRSGRRSSSTKAARAWGPAWPRSATGSARARRRCPARSASASRRP